MRAGWSVVVVVLASTAIACSPSANDSSDPCEPETCAAANAECGTCPQSTPCSPERKCEPNSAPPTMDPAVEITLLSNEGDCAGIVPAAPASHVQHVQQGNFGWECHAGTSDGAGDIALNRTEDDHNESWSFVPAGSTKVSGSHPGLRNESSLVPQPTGFHAVECEHVNSTPETLELLVLAGDGTITRRVTLSTPAERVGTACGVLGGGVGQGSVATIAFKPLDPYEYTTYRAWGFDAAGNTVFGPVDLSVNAYNDALLASAITRDGYVAAVVTNLDDPYGNWMSPSGAVLARIEGTSPDTLPYLSGVHWLPLSDGSLAAYGGFRSQTSGWGWKTVVRPNGTSSFPPAWLTARGRDMFVLPGAKGYAEAFGAHDTAGACAANVELYSNSGAHCGSVKFKVKDGGCDANFNTPLELGIGLDGTVIMEVAPADANVTCTSESCACVRWWWPQLLK